MNSVSLTGRLTRDIELRYTQGGDAVGTFNLAVNRTFKNANGEREADFIQCVVWRKQAENAANFTHKGSRVGVVGRIQTRNYEKDGQRVYVTEVVADSVEFLDTRAENQNNQQSNNQGGNFNNVSVPNNIPSNNGAQIDINESQLPF